MAALWLAGRRLSLKPAAAALISSAVYERTVSSSAAVSFINITDSLHRLHTHQ